MVMFWGGGAVVGGIWYDAMNSYLLLIYIYLYIFIYKLNLKFFSFFFFSNHTRFNTPEGLCEIYIQYIDETQASRLFLVPSLTPLLPYTKKDLHSRALRTRIYEFSSSSSYSGSSVA